MATIGGTGNHCELIAEKLASTDIDRDQRYDEAMKMAQRR